MKKNFKITAPTKKLMGTVAGVIVAYVIMEILINTGHVSSLIQGLLVPVCIYSIAAVALNLCVGYLGELSLGHAGFMCIGAFSSAYFSKLNADTMSDGPR
ncbi:MAG: branched-chain amino acid ABC transporter permease, partial [Pseudobutyrivibrio sp.]|nr:branched-chain amino acid ABC transporter permease [Pseudobutyrivibrio sp.]